MKTKVNAKRTTISMLLIVALLITMAVPAFANSFAADDSRYDEIVTIQEWEQALRDVYATRSRHLDYTKRGNLRVWAYVDELGKCRR